MRGGAGNIPAYSAKSQNDGAGVAAAGQGFEATPAIDLEHAGEAGQLGQRAAVLAAIGVDVDHGRGQWAVPRAVVAGEREPEREVPEATLRAQERQRQASQVMAR